MKNTVLDRKKQIKQLTQELKASETRFFSIVDANPDGIIIVNRQHILCYANAAAETLFNRKADEFIGDKIDLPLTLEKSFEISIDQGNGKSTIVEIRVVETRWEGQLAYLASLRNVTEAWQMRKKLEDTNNALNQTIEQLRTANRLIIDQQKSVIAEERLTLLLQMAGAIAHDLNQPLMALLGNLELTKMTAATDHEKRSKYLERIEEAGLRISDSVKKLQHIREDQTIAHDSNSTIINLDQKINILLAQKSHNGNGHIQKVLKNQTQMNIIPVYRVEKLIGLLDQVQCDMIIADFVLEDGNAFDLLQKMEEREKEIPVILLTPPKNEPTAVELSKSFDVEYIPVENIKISDGAYILDRIAATLEKNKQKREMSNTRKIVSGISSNSSQALMYNRIYFLETLEREIAQAERNKNEFVLYMMILNRFDEIVGIENRSVHHYSFSQYARILKQCLRKSDLICRFSNDELGIILPNTSRKNSDIVSERIHKNISQLNHAPKKQLYPMMDIGMSYFYPGLTATPSTMISNAKQAAYRK